MPKGDVYIQLASPDEVRAALEKMRGGRTFDELAKTLGVSRRSLFYYQRDGIGYYLTESAAAVIQMTKVRSGKRKRHFRITDEGHAALKSNREVLAELSK